MVMSTEQAARAYGVSATTLRRWIEGGLLPAVKVGKTWVLEAKDVESAMAHRPRKTGRPRKESP